MIRVVCWKLSLSIFFLLTTSLVWAANTHNLGSDRREFQAWFFDQTDIGFVTAGCLPAVPASSLSLAAFSCDAYVRDTTTNELIFVRQTATGITIADATPTWLAIHKDRSTAVSGWTRVTATHYLYRQAATQPDDPDDAVVFAQVTVAASVISAIRHLAFRSITDAVLRSHSVLSWGAVCDGSTDDSTAIQRAMDAGNIRLPPLTCAIGSTTLTLSRNGQRVEGAGNLLSTIDYNGTDSAFESVDQTTPLRDITLRDFKIFSDQDDAHGLDFTGILYSNFVRLFIEVDGNNTEAIRGTISATAGAYYNRFEQNHLEGNNADGGTSGSIGMHFDCISTTPFTQFCPNANWVTGGRIINFTTQVLLNGSGNTFAGVYTEGARPTGRHWLIGDDVVHDTGTAESGTSTTLTDTDKSWPTDELFRGTVRITSGTGNGQYRVIASNTATVITVFYPWQTVPDNTSVYSVYDITAIDNTLIGNYIEGCQGGTPCTGYQVSANANGNAIQPGHLSSVTTDWDVAVGNEFDKLGFGNIRKWTWTYTDVTISLNDVDMYLFGDTNQAEILAPDDMSIVAMALRSNANRSAGVLTASMSIGGSESSTLFITLNADLVNNVYFWIPFEDEKVSRGTIVKALLTTDGAWAPTTADINLEVYAIVGR